MHKIASWTLSAVGFSRLYGNRNQVVAMFALSRGGNTRRCQETAHRFVQRRRIIGTTFTTKNERNEKAHIALPAKIHSDGFPELSDADSPEMKFPSERLKIQGKRGWPTASSGWSSGGKRNARETRERDRDGVAEQRGSGGGREY